MKASRMAVTVLLAVGLVGCASVQYGDKDTEASLRRMAPIPGKTSLYVCREAAVLMGAGNRTTVMVDGKSIGTLKPNNFAHAVVEPGPHQIFIRRNPGGDSGILKIDTQPGEVAFVWVGMTGGGFGVLTVDHFSSKGEGEQCVKSAQYAIRAE